MPDYQKGKIYKLWSPQGNEIYIGSTINTLANRLGHHKKPSNNCNSKYLFENYTDVRIELIEAYPCNNKMELNRREGEHMRANVCLNKFIPCRTHQEYYKDNIEKIKEYRRANKEKRAEYLEANREKIAEKKKEWYENNKPKILEQTKEYYEANKEKIAEYREANKEKMAEYRKEYYENNKERASQKIKCECGCEVRRDCLLRHRRSNNHKELIKQMQSQHQD